MYPSANCYSTMKIRMPRNLSRSCSDLRTIDGVKTFDIPVKLMPLKENGTTKKSSGVKVHDVCAQTQNEENCDTPRVCYHRDSNRQHVIVIEQVITIHNGSGDVQTVSHPNEEIRETRQKRDVKSSHDTSDHDIDSQADDLLTDPSYSHIDNADLCSQESFDEYVDLGFVNGYSHLPQTALDDCLAPKHPMDMYKISDRLTDFETRPGSTEHTSIRCTRPTFRKVLTIALCMAVVLALVFSLTVIIFLYPTYRDSSQHYITDGGTTMPSTGIPSNLPQPTAETAAITTTIETKTRVTAVTQDRRIEPPLDNTQTSEEKSENAPKYVNTQQESNENAGGGSFQEMPVVRVKLKKIAYNDTHSLIYFNSTGESKVFKHPKF